MYRKLAVALGLFLLGSQVAFSEVAPVKHLAGKSDDGQPHLYWFGAAAVESEVGFDDGSKELFAYVSDFYPDNQALVLFSLTSAIPPRFHLLTELSALVAPGQPVDTASTFVLSIRKYAGLTPPAEYLFMDTLSVIWRGNDSVWVRVKPAVLLIDPEPSFWGSLHWLNSTPINPFLGRDVNPDCPNSYVGYAGIYSQPYLGNWMIRTKLMTNYSGNEMAGSFWVYRGTDSNSVFHAITVNQVQFDFLDSPPATDDYYYRVSRWQNGEESPLSNAIGLTAFPTAAEDREVGKHVFLLSEPFPNPTSASVLFTARTDKLMPLGFSIYNLLGQKVFSKPAAAYPAGEHRFFWNGQDDSGRRLSSGLYLLRFQAGEEVLVKKITLLR